LPMPMPIRWRLLVLPLLAVLVTRSESAPPFGEFRVRMLDVGQGLAVIVETQRHRLIYDAGARYASGFDVGDAIVVPAVLAVGGRRADVLMISHDHLDHAGGADAVKRELRTTHWMGGGGFEDLAMHNYCRAGDRWQWDGVAFEVLYPPEPWRLSANDGSCVLRVDNGARAALLPGDVERLAEGTLVARELLAPVDLLVSPHHGSRTSSSALFLAALSPRMVFVSSGHRNRYGHPHDVVMARYETLGANVYVTAQSGALTWTSAEPERVIEQRRVSPRYWRAVIID
jgi:competence protein ComEC